MSVSLAAAPQFQYDARMHEATSLSRYKPILFWDAPFRRQFLNLALPMAAQYVISSSMHLLDNVMVGRVGEIEMAAVVQANLVTFVFQLTLFGLTSGAAAFAAQAWGKRDVRRIHEVMGLTLVFGIAFVLLFGSVSLFAPRLVLRHLLTDDRAIALGCQYLRISAAGYVLEMLVEIHGSFQKCTEKARLSFIGVSAAVLTNTLLNYLLIFGRLGLPRMGVLGAALATLIANGVSAVIVVGGGYRMAYVAAPRFRDLLPRTKGLLRQFVRVAGVVVANECFWAIGVSLYSLVYGKMGEGAVAAYSIAKTFEQFSASVVRAITMAASVLVGAKVGAGDNPGATLVAKRLIFALLVCAGLAGVLLATAGGVVAGVFNISEAAKRDAVRLIRVIACYMPLGMLNGMLVVGVMRAGGDTTSAMLVDTLPVWLVGAPMAFLALALRLPVMWVCVFSRTENLVKLVFGARRFASGKWMRNLNAAGIR